MAAAGGGRVGGGGTSPHISFDGLTLWLDTGGNDVSVATRPSRGAAWTAPTVIAELVGQDDGASVTVDELAMVFDSNRTGDFDIYLSTRSSRTAAWGTALPIAEINTPYFEGRPHLSADKLTIYFHYKPNGNPNQDLYVAHRAVATNLFGPSAPIDGVNDPIAVDEDPWVSADERHLVFSSQRGSTSTLWEAWR